MASSAEHRARQWPKEGWTRVPYWVYSDPELYRRELELFFYGPTWNYVGLSCEVPEAGCYKRSWIGERQVVMVRDHDDRLHVWENRCAHRGARLCWSNKGKTESMTCPYHQWNYALDGRLQGVPLRRGAAGKGGMPSDFDPARHGLSRLRVHLESGSVWASFDHEGPSFAEYCGAELYGYLQRIFPGRPLSLLRYSRQLIQSNWKLYLENLKDPYHATLLHAFYITFGMWRADAEAESRPVQGGKHSIMTSKNVGKQASAATAEISRFNAELELHDRDTVTPVREFDDGKVGGWTIFPSVVIHQQANSLGMRHVVPKGPGEFELSWTYFGYADEPPELTRLRLRHTNLMGPAGFVSMEDGEVLSECQLNVAGYADRAAVVEMGGRDVAPQDHMVTEVMIRAFYDFYREAMGL